MIINSVMYKISSSISVISGIFAFVIYMRFRRVVIKNEDKRVEEIEAQLNKLLNLMMAATILSGVFGLIAVLTR